MIFYGTKATNIHNGKVINVKCPNCEANTSMTYSIFGKYAHVYWIPFFPIGTVGVIECDSCKRTFEVKELPEEIKTKYIRDTERSSIKKPIWYYSGLFIITLVVAYGFYSSKESKIEQSTYIESPQKGDLYEITASSGYYSTMKIDSVLSDSIYFFVNDMETNKKSGISDIDKEKNYKELYGFSKVEIKEMFESEKIYEISR